MIIVALLVVWFGMSVVFCLALARAAGKPLPKPDALAGEEPVFAAGYEAAYEPAVQRLKPTFGNQVAVPS